MNFIMILQGNIHSVGRDRPIRQEVNWRKLNEINIKLIISVRLGRWTFGKTSMIHTEETEYMSKVWSVGMMQEWKSSVFRHVRNYCKWINLSIPTSTFCDFMRIYMKLNNNCSFTTQTEPKRTNTKLKKKTCVTSLRFSRRQFV